MLARQAAAAVGVGTCWPCETADMLPPSARRRKALWRPRGGERQGHIVAAARLQLVFSSNTTVLKMYYIFVTYFYCKLLYFIKYSNTANYVNYPLIIFFSDNEPME